MSNALAIASVTAVLKDLLNNGVIDHNLSASVGEVIVSALPPDRIDALEAEKKSRLNLFLYQVTPNQGWRNVGLPSRDARGEHLTNPPLAVDLHYLLTAYGAEEFHAEILLGYGMQLLHETPVLTRDAIRRSLAPPSPVVAGGDLPPVLAALFTSELAEQVEQIKVWPQSLNTEEISRMWAAFQAKYRPTAAYQASVVLIESRQSTRSSLPVRKRNIYVAPFRQPIIEQLLSQVSANAPILSNQPILAGHRLVLRGQQLRGEDTRVRVGGIEVVPTASDITDSQVIAPIPASLRAGVQGVQVIHPRLMGDPPMPHRGVESNAVPFVLRPLITAPIGVTNLQGSGSNLRSAILHLAVTPAVGDAQRAIVLLNEFQPAMPSPPANNESKALAYSFQVPARDLLSPPDASEHVSVPLSGIRAGAYLVRIQVNGAESPLGVDAVGQYNSPLVTIP